MGMLVDRIKDYLTIAVISCLWFCFSSAVLILIMIIPCELGYMLFSWFDPSSGLYGVGFALCLGFSLLLRSHRNEIRKLEEQIHCLEELYEKPALEKLGFNWSRRFFN